jgi:spore germination protein (amino acid permease)
MNHSKMNNELIAIRHSPVMLFTLLFVAILGIDFLVSPYDAARTCGSSAYWAVLAALILVLPLIFLLILFQRRFPTENLFEVAFRVLGRPLGTFGNILYLGFLGAYLIIMQRHTVEFLTAYLLDRTPGWVTSLAILGGVGYIAINGLSAVSRLAAFILIPTALFRAGMKLLALQGLNPMHLLPLFSVPLVKYLEGGLALASALIPLGAGFLLYPLVKKPQKIGLVALSATGGTTLFLLLSIIGTVGVFGGEVSAEFNWPVFELVRRINFPYFVLEQVGLLLIIVWFTMFFAAAAFFFYILAAGLKQQFSFLNYRWTVTGLLIFTFITGLMFPNLSSNMRILMGYRRWALIPVMVYPLLVYLAALVRGYRGCGHE